MKRKCPICGEPCAGPAVNPYFPFCSERCQLVDLGRWLEGDYRIPGEPVDIEAESEPDEGEEYC